MRVKKKWFIPIGILALSSWFLYRENNQIDTTAVTIQSEKLPAAFNDYTILQIADLHGKSFGSRQKVLLKKVNKLQPDVILMTGDLIDSRRNGEEEALLLMKQLTPDYPVYFVTGNHEVRLNLTILPKLERLGVTVLRNTSVPLERDGQFIELLGIDDPTTTRWSEGLQEPDGIRKSLDQAQSTAEPRAFQLLMAHRPEYLPLYAERKVDLVLSGHAHGGQIRLPFTDGMYAPGQGFFPDLTAGQHTMENTRLIISRGLGNSLFPFRIFNHPELIVVTLRT
ncbi:MAG TPA: metallophosphoesterase [Exiguobacterium sp.]|uniref:metallophosphoesterase n=1 Tax=Exiguobacterium TaxID=33986 RepID=UPI000EC98F82|nr:MULTISPECIES: metallophosphoesterase [Exiguobacterium]MDW2884562.1 metallophosphoesterase [Exiguobacterium sibiricum]HCN58299.1 metallophosphoesterase [Exiguobacterium sp.]